MYRDTNSGHKRGDKFGNGRLQMSLPCSTDGTHLKNLKIK
jgi:hypothetical protein